MEELKCLEVNLVLPASIVRNKKLWNTLMDMLSDIVA